MRLRLRDRLLQLRAGRPLVMGILNAAPDSFSDPGPRVPAELLARGRSMVAAGADLLDVGGQSGRTDRPAVSEDEEAARVVGLVERLAREGIAVSVDTWRHGPARAALAAGAAMVNDVSGLADPTLAELCAACGAALVITHTRAAPKTKAFPAYDDVVADAVELLRERSATARSRGLAPDRIVLDPGLDLAKSPAESIELIRRLPELAALGRPLLLAISRKDFLGAICGRSPAARDAATLAAVEPALDLPGAILRVHDVAATADFLAVRATLRGEAEPPAVHLAPELRTEDAA